MAQVQNATLAQVAAALGKTEAQVQDFPVADLPSLATLRTALPRSMVTIFTYNPLIGVATKTDPNGFNTSFFYDTANRLKLVKDLDNNIISLFEYNYRK